MNTPNYYNYALVVFSDHGTNSWGSEVAIVDHQVVGRVWSDHCRPLMDDLQSLWAKYRPAVRLDFTAHLTPEERFFVVFGDEAVYDYFRARVDHVVLDGTGGNELREAMAAASRGGKLASLAFLARLNEMNDGGGSYIPFAGPVIEPVGEGPDSTFSVSQHGAMLMLDDEGRWVGISIKGV